MEFIMPTVNSNIEVQKYLKDNGLYDGPLDGKMGPKTLSGINALLSDNDIDLKGWNRNRKLIGAEQLLYKKQKIEVGKVDGLIGPQTRHARDVYNANLVSTWRDKVQTFDPPKTADKKITEAHRDWPLQRDCMRYYGKPGSNQVTCELPFEMVLAWDTKTKVQRYSCHRLVKDSMERIWNRTIDFYGYQKIKELRLHYFGGCLNVRQMRGGSAWSMHSWGIAVDIDPDRNGLHTSWKNAQMSKPDYKRFVQFWYDEGAINLGMEANYDSMHFQFARLR
jgi:hypothetical protein